MSVVSFRYDDEAWLKLEAIISRAGGDAAKEKFTAGRASFEKQAGGWKMRIAGRDGRTWGRDDTGKYERIERAALELVEALDDLNFPAIFSGNDLVWVSPCEPSLRDDESFGRYQKENHERFSRFREALGHVRLRAKRMAAKNPKRKNQARDYFFAELTRVWRDDLGLNVGVSANSLLVAFIEIAASSMCGLREATAKDAISNAIRKWKPKGVKIASKIF
jgi:hypothetical protein